LIGNYPKSNSFNANTHLKTLRELLPARTALINPSEYTLPAVIRKSTLFDKDGIVGSTVAFRSIRHYFFFKKKIGSIEKKLNKTGVKSHVEDPALRVTAELIEMAQ